MPKAISRMPTWHMVNGSRSRIVVGLCMQDDTGSDEFFLPISYSYAWVYWVLKKPLSRSITYHKQDCRRTNIEASKFKHSNSAVVVFLIHRSLFGF